MEQLNFIDFILDSLESEKLTEDFLKTKSKEELAKFFGSMPQYGLKPDEIDKIWRIKEKLPPIPPWGPRPEPKY